MNSIQYKAELALVKSQNIDITNFEDKMNRFKEGFARNYDLASRKFKEAIDGIDKTIKIGEDQNRFVIIRKQSSPGKWKTEDLTIKEADVRQPDNEKPNLTNEQSN